MALDLALPKTGPLRERLAAYFDDFPPADFVMDVLTEELDRRNETYEQEQKLTDLDGYQDPARVADNLIDRFQTLPWSYVLTFALPHLLHELIPADSTTVELSPQLRICRPTQDFQGLYPLETDNPELNNRLLGPTGFFSPHPKGARAQWEPGAVYFQIQVEGFIGRYALSPTVNAAEHLVRSFFGLGLATEVFKSSGFFRAHSRTIPVYVHRATRDGSWKPSTIYTLSPSVGRGLHSLTVGDPNDALRIEPPDTEGLMTKLAHIKTVLGLGGNQAAQVLLAAQWLFDGSTGDDPLLTFVQSMVVLEILLGDRAASSDTSISTLISNRFAYLVGKTHDEREQHIATFKKIYDVRSQIVHSGKSRLRSEDRRLLAELLQMGRAAIVKEVDMLLASKKTLL